MTLPESFWTGFWANFPAIIGAIGGIGAWFVSWRNGRKSAAGREEVKTQVSALAGQVDDIHQTTQAIAANSASAPLGKV